jgi:hypothetical protein
MSRPVKREVGWGTAAAKLRAKSFTLDGEAVVLRGTVWGAEREEDERRRLLADAYLRIIEFRSRAG